MKKKQWMVYTLLGVAFTLTLGSCVDSEKDISQPQDRGKTTELNVPTNFDWATSQNVEMGFTAPANATISLYTDQHCTDKNKIAQFSVYKGETTDLKFDIPNGCEAVYIKYPTKDNGTGVGTILMNSLKTKAPLVIDLGNLNGFYGYESTHPMPGVFDIFTSGTIMFEDNWPEMGDYDMNDLVADYQVKTIWSDRDKDSNPDETKVQEKIEVTVTIRAIGGYLPAKLGVQFLGKNEGAFKSLRQKHITDYVMPAPVRGVSVRLANPDQPEQTPIFYIEGLENLKNGNTYYNTEKKDDSNLATLKFTMNINSFNDLEKSTALSQSALAANQDFFLVTKEGREIHLRGYEPSILYTKYAEDAAKATEKLNSTNKYSTDKNFVWGLKICANGFRYPMEKVDIREAFSNDVFGKWVETGGNDPQYHNWFKYYDLNKTIE